MNELNFTNIGHRIRKQRIKEDITQEALAASVDVNPSHISNIENGKVKVSLTLLTGIANALHTTVDYFLMEEYLPTSNVLDAEIQKALEHCGTEKKEKILKIIQIL